VISGIVLYGNGSECNNSTVNIANLNTSGAWVAETNDSSNYYQMVLDSDNVSVNNTLQFNAISPDESQSSVTEHVVTQDELDNGGFVYNITLGIVSVTANGIPLADAGNDTYEGNITAENASGTYNVTVVATDNSTNSNNVTDDSATYTVPTQGDTTPPTIHSVLLDPTVVAPSGLINVTVNVTDASGIVPST
jgi:hypothetical protein